VCVRESVCLPGVCSAPLHHSGAQHRPCSTSCSHYIFIPATLNSGDPLSKNTAPSPSFLFVSLPHSPPGESRGMKTSDISCELTSHLERGGPHASVSVLYCSGTVLQCSRKSFKVPSLCFPPPCSALQPAFNKTPDCLSRHTLLLATHTPSQCILYWVIYLSITPPCTPPAGSLQVQHRLMKRSARGGRERWAWGYMDLRVSVSLKNLIGFMVKW